MPLTPRGGARLKVTGENGTVIFEGEGEVVLGLDPAVSGPGALTQTAVLRIHDGNYHAQLDLTGLVSTTPHTWTRTYDTPEMDWDPCPDPLRLPDPPRVLETCLEIDISPEFALALRRELYRGHPDHQDRPQSTFRDLLGSVTRSPDYEYLTLGEEDRIVSAGPDWFQELRRVLATRTPAARQRIIERLVEDSSPDFRFEQSALEELYGRGVMTPQAFREQANLPDRTYEAREELIRSTRAEFPHDPYDYGRRHPEGPSRWTPPEDPEEVIPSCPA